MKKIVLIMVLMIVLASAVLIGAICSARAQPSNTMQDDAVALVKAITYVKDKKTGLCFAVVNAFRRSVMTTVPCNLKVSYREAE